jgi:hypothetical protein
MKNRAPEARRQYGSGVPIPKDKKLHGESRKNRERLWTAKNQELIMKTRLGIRRKPQIERTGKGPKVNTSQWLRVLSIIERAII